MKGYKFLAVNVDVLATLIIFLASFVFYYLGCKELLASGFYQQINIAFDLDQSHFFYSVGHDVDTARVLLIKHPFIYLYNYIILPLNYIGLSDNISIILLSQLFHSGSLVISYYIFRTVGRTTLESSLLTCGLAGTSTYISSGFVLDVYSLSMFWIAAIFLIVSRAGYQNHTSSVWLRMIISVMAIGTTSYLIVLVILMELFLANTFEEKIFNTFKSKLLYKQILRVFTLGAILFVMIYFQVIIEIIQDPIAVLKRVFWTVNRPGDKEGIFQVITVFALFSILSPKVSIILLPEGITMIDLRAMDFNVLGWFIIIILMVSLFLKFNNKKHFYLLLFCLLWLAFNIIFHTIYQYRGSLFLYSGHMVLSVWIIYFSSIENSTYKLNWFQGVYNKLDKILIYIMPILIWNNNLYLYQEINTLSW